MLGLVLVLCLFSIGFVFVWLPFLLVLCVKDYNFSKTV